MVPHFLQQKLNMSQMPMTLTLYIILFQSPVCHYLITYKNLILVSFLYIIIDFVLCINIYATFLPNFVSIKAVFVDFFCIVKCKKKINIIQKQSSCLTFGCECIMYCIFVRRNTRRRKYVVFNFKGDEIYRFCFK